jgi:cytochrome P450
LRLPVDRALDRHLAVVHAVVADLIAKARARLEREPGLRESPTNLLEAMLVERESANSGLNDDDVASNVITLLLAGEDTTANTVAWLIHLASLDSRVMRRLADEADAVLRDMRFPERLDVALALSFTAACALETMRLKPVAPIIALESTAATVVAGDLAIPGGTVVLALMRAGAMDPRHFERPETFEPERWLDKQGGALSIVGERIAMPFGAGPRICPGRNLALLEINMVTSMLFRNFEIADIRTADGGPVEEWLAFTMSPSRLMVTLAPRSAAAGFPTPA